MSSRIIVINIVQYLSYILLYREYVRFDKCESARTPALFPESGDADIRMCPDLQTKFARRLSGSVGVCESPLKFYSAVWPPTIRYPTRAARATHRLSSPPESVSPIYTRTHTHTCVIVREDHGRASWAELIPRLSPQLETTFPDPHRATYYHLPISQPPQTDTYVSS